MRTFLLLGAMLAFFTMSASPARAWGERGHRLVAELAYARLTPAARAEVDRLTQTDASATPGCAVHSFADAAVWSDCVRAISAYRNQSPWHYDNIPLCGAAAYESYCANGDCATAAIARAERTLRNPRAPERDRARALARLIHFMGDIHQPLHAIDNHDRGGNDINVTILAQGAWASSGQRNLHAVWDTLLVDYALGADQTAARSNLQALINAHAGEWARGDVQSWTREAHDLGVSRVYGALPVAPMCGAPPPRSETLGIGYAEAGAPIVRMQLARAAVRLATRLNLIFAD